MQKTRRVVGRRIADARIRSGFTVQDLARLLDISARDLRQLEAGQMPLTLALARRIGEALNIATAALLDANQALQSTTGPEPNGSDMRSWTARVVQAILDEGRYLSPPRPMEVSARLIAYFAARPDRLFEVEIYEERVRSLRARAQLQTASANGENG